MLFAAEALEVGLLEFDLPESEPPDFEPSDVEALESELGVLTGLESALPESALPELLESESVFFAAFPFDFSDGRESVL